MVSQRNKVGTEDTVDVQLKRIKELEEEVARLKKKIEDYESRGRSMGVAYGFMRR